MAHARTLAARALVMSATSLGLTAAVWAVVGSSTAGAVGIPAVPAASVSTEAPSSTPSLDVSPVPPSQWSSDPAPSAVAQQQGIGVSVIGGSGSSAPGPLHETIGITVIGGSMTVHPASVAVTLHRDGDRYVGTFGPITVNDARGTLVGWRAWLSLPGWTDGTLVAHPGSPVAISGLQHEVAQAGTGNVSDAPTIMSAPAGGGGGSFRVSGTLELRGASGDDPDTITVTPSVGVA